MSAVCAVWGIRCEYEIVGSAMQLSALAICTQSMSLFVHNAKFRGHNLSTAKLAVSKPVLTLLRQNSAIST